MNDHASGGDIDVDALMRQIREEVQQRAGSGAVASRRPITASSPSTQAMPDFMHWALPRVTESVPPLERKPAYALNEFLQYHDQDFVRSAYRGLLRREPDPEGASRFLSKLRSGDLSKIEILGRIRFSPEGRTSATAVSGLALPFTIRSLRRIPVLGHVIGIAQYVVRLPTLVRNHERLEAVFFHERSESHHNVNMLAAAVESAVKDAVGHADSYQDAVQQLEVKLAASQREALLARQRLADSLALKAARQELGVLANTLREAIAASRSEIVAILERGSAEALEQRKIDNAEVDARLTAVHSSLTEAAARMVERAEYEMVVGNMDVRLVGTARDAAVLSDRFNELSQELAGLQSSKLDQSAFDGHYERLEADLAALRAQLVVLQRASLEHDRRLAQRRDQKDAEAASPLEPRGEGVDVESVLPLESFYVAFEDAFRGTREDIKARVAVYLPHIRAAAAGTPNAPVLDVGCGRGEWLELLGDNGLEAIGVELNRSMAAESRERGLNVVDGDAVDYLRGLPADSLGAITAMHVIEHLPFTRMIALFDEARRVLRPNGVAIFETPNPENLIVGACNFWYDPTHQRPLPPEPMRFVLDNRGFTKVDIIRLHPMPEFETRAEGEGALEPAIAARLYGPQDYAVIGFKA